MCKNIFYQFGRTALFGITLFAFLTLAPGGSFVANALDDPEMPPNDALDLPATVKSRQTTVERFLASAPIASHAPGYYDTSAYMLGDVAVGIILPESNGHGEDWTQTEKDLVVSEIQTGLDWWKTTGGVLADLNFEYDLQLGVSTTYEPISLLQSEQGLWIGDVMNNLGYTSGDYWDRVYAYENDIRNQYQTDWAFTIFVVDSSADVDGKFADGKYFAYAYVGGPFLVMTYDNDGWGIDDMDKITAHETAHIFMAADQYEESACSPTRKYGYLGVVNGNCDTIINGIDDGAPSLMKTNDWVLDSYAREQIGWRDSDSDTIPDVLDTVPVVTLDPYWPDPTSSSTLSYTGYVTNPVYPHAVCGTEDFCYTTDVTTQSIDSVNFQVDGGTWNPAIAQDEGFDLDVEDFSFSTDSLASGTHSINVTSENSSGNKSSTWHDSVLVNAPASAVSAGVYDDTHGDWVYNGNWTAATASGPYNGTLHYSTTLNDEATLDFVGTQFILTYTGNSNRGNVNVFVDNVNVGTINQYSASLTWQKTWTSPIFTDSAHTLRLVHASGAYAGVDAIEILQVTPLGPGTYDDTHSNWGYNGNWTPLTTNGPYNGTLHYSTTLNNSATLVFEGARFTLTYTGNSNRGQMDIYVDNVNVGTINQYSASLTWQKTWSSPIFTNDFHTLKLVHKSGSVVGIDAIEIIEITPLGAGTYDDTDTSWYYSGNWTAATVSGPYNDTLHYSTTFNNFALVMFEGSQFKLTYTGNTNRGNVIVYVDNVNVGTINQKTANLTWQKTWTSPVFTNGAHTLKLVHASGAYAGIDAIEILAPLSSGTYDDIDNAWYYNGNWTAYTTSGPYNDTLHYSTAINDYAMLAFDGFQFKLTYTKHVNRGNVDVYLDGVKVDTVNQYSPTLAWQQTWTSTVFTEGFHTLKLVHTTGSYVGIDAVQIIGTPDTTPPAAIDDLQATTSALFRSVDLSWTAVGDNGSTGRASTYLVRYRPASEGAINDDASWNQATPVITGIPSPKSSGQTENMTISNLDPGKTYYFAVRAQDEVPNTGAVSTVTTNSSAEAFSPPPPLNDNFSHPIDITNLPLPYTDSNDYFYAATTEAGDPQIVQCNSDEGKYSIWYTYTPQVTAY